MTHRSVRTMSVLFEKLNQCAKIAEYDQKRRLEAETLAHGLSDIMDSCETYLYELLPRLLKAETEEEIIDVLQEIGHELGHIYYHMTDSRYLWRYIDLHKAQE